jgi:molybdate transport repressor ModE-like protein
MSPAARVISGASASAPAAGGLEVRQLRVLVALADAGTMTGAARALGVAQSTVSESVAALERALGAAAVERRRGGRSLSLTAIGWAVLPHARNVLNTLEQAQAAVAAVTHAARARLGLIANESVATYLLPRALAAVRARWPNVRFDVTVGTCDAVRQGVEREAFDLGLSFEIARSSRKEGPRGAGGQELELAAVPLVAFCSPRHPLARAAGVTSRAALAGYPVFWSDAAGEFHALLERAFRSADAPRPQAESAGSVEAVKRSVRDEVRAVAVLPRYAIAEELASGAVCALRLRPALPSVLLQARLGSSAPHPVAAELIAELRAGLEKRDAS